MANVQMPTYRGTTTYCNSIAKADGNLLFDTTTKDIYMDVGTGTNDRIKFTTKTTSLAASAVTFNNSGTGMSATKVQDAITELNTHLSNKADKVWTTAGAIYALNTPVTVPTTGVSELLIAGAVNINGQAEISDTVVIPMQFLSQDRVLRLQFGFHSEIGQMQVSYIKNNSAFYITNEYYSIGTITSRAMVVYYR